MKTFEKIFCLYMLSMLPVIIIAQFHVTGRFLQNSAGETVLLRGVNVPIYGSGWRNDVTEVADAISTNTKSNAVRMLWYSSKVLNEIGNPPYYSSLQNLDNAITTYADRHILSVVYLGDLTAAYNNSITAFNDDIVPFWTNPDVIALIKKHKEHLIINLANEWGATWDAGSLGTSHGTTDFINTYTNLITQLRNNDISVPIMIDSPDGGSNSSFLINVGSSLINNDPLHNILLSVHTYWSKGNTAITNCPDDYISRMQAMKNSNLPFILGEASDWTVDQGGTDHESIPPVDFSCENNSAANKYTVNYDALLTEAVNDQIGFLAWAWYQDGLIVRNIYNQNSGTSVNNTANAGSWPVDILSNTKIYGLNNPSLVSALPINLSSFTVQLTGNNAMLQWTTSSEINSDYFDVQRSTDKLNFSTIAKINAAGYSMQLETYHHTDDISVVNAPVIYYRIHEVDKDGKYQNSKTISVEKASPSNKFLKAYPNPVAKVLTVEINSNISQSISLSISNEVGQIIKHTIYKIAKGRNTIYINTKNLSSGIYFLSAIENNNVQHTTKIIKD